MVLRERCRVVYLSGVIVPCCPAELAIDAEVDLCLADGGYFLQARLNVSLPGVEREVAQTLVDAAHQTCPYSKAIRGNVNVVITLI
jgi:osmotically inducible protein OsmC